MMYCNGDLEDPIPCCVDMVFDLVKFQMVKVLEDAWHRACIQQRKSITLEDVLFLFRRNKFLLKRLLHFAETIESINELKQAAPRTEKLDNDPDEDSECDDDELKRTNIPDSNLTRMKNFVNSIGLAESANDLLELFDSELYERQRRIANTVMNDMSVEEYSRFTAARTATFLDDNRGNAKKKHEQSNLLWWLGAPQCEPSVSFVLAFIGREVVAYYVDAAVTVMRTEESNLFRCDTKDGYAAAPNEDCPLQVRHYTEALRRCEGWRRYGDFLFGYHEDTEENEC